MGPCESVQEAANRSGAGAPPGLAVPAYGARADYDLVGTLHHAISKYLFNFD